MPYYVYILANRTKGTLYVGSTSDLVRRVWQHKQKLLEGFTARYSVSRLVYFEEFQEVTDMGQRERRLKEWKRRWKIELIERDNPKWDDLFEELF